MRAGLRSSGARLSPHDCENRHVSYAAGPIQNVNNIYYYYTIHRDISPRPGIFIKIQANIVCLEMVARYTCLRHV